MPITRYDISQATGTDKKYLLTCIQLEDDIQQILDNYSNDSYDLIMSNASASGLQKQDETITGLIALLAACLLLVDTRMLEGIKDIANVKASAILEEGLPLLRSAGATDAANAFKLRMANFENDMATSFRVMKSGKYELSYNDRMAAIEESGARVIRNLVQSDIRDGIPARDIAMKLDRYINPVPNEAPVRPWDVIRNATNSNKSFVPKTVLPGSIQTNVHDVVRTQSALSNRQATIRIGDKEPWITGYKWVLSSSHPKVDICDELEAANPYPKDGSQPQSHNHCRCDYVPIYATREQIKALLAKGDL